MDQDEHPSSQDPEGWAASGRDWAAQHTATIGESIARWRGRRKLSAQRLAERCSRLGMPSITRTVITKLENGRKESISTAELAILATALEVPPAILMFPIGERDSVETTPGMGIEPLDAVYWFSGMRADLYGEAAVKGSALDFFIMHRRIVDALLRGTSIWQTFGHASPQPVMPIRVEEYTFNDFQLARGRPPLPHEEQLAQEMHQNASYLRTTRKAIRQLGLKPPPLPPELTGIDDPASDDGVPGLPLADSGG